jgi:hypothetical protein
MTSTEQAMTSAEQAQAPGVKRTISSGTSRVLLGTK